MKKLFLLLFLATATFAVRAQYTFYTSNYDLVDKQTKQSKSNETKRQIYNISFKDNVLVHNVFESEDDAISDSQLYQIIRMEEITDGLIEFTAESGVTGNTYTYRLKVVEDGETTLTLVVKDEDYNIRYNGTLSTMKTFKQE